MWNRFKNMLQARPTKRSLDPDTPFALYFAPSGKVTPITPRSIKSFGWGGYDALQNSMARPNSNGNATASELGYAYISEINVWVRRCIEIRAQNLARLDWYVEDKRTGKRIDNHPMMVAINRSRRFFVRYARSMDIFGEVYLKPLANEFGYYSDVWRLNNLSVNFAIVNGQIDQFYFVPLHGGKPHVWQPDEMAYIYNENEFDDLHGSSRILSVLAEANVHEEIARSAQAHLANDARPGIMFIPENDLGTDQSQEFLDYWKENFQGSLNTNKPVMLPMQIKSVQTIERASLKDDVELRGSVRREICAAFGVPLSIAGAWDDANYQSAPEQRKSLYEDTLIPEAEQMSKDMERILLPFYGNPETQKIWFDAKKLLALAEDKQAKATALNSQLVSGGITLNQYREALDLEAIPQGNVFYIPSGVVVTPIEKIGTMPPPAPPGGFGFQSAPALPAPAPVEPPKAPIEEPAKSGNKVSVTLSLANNADCIALQQRLKELYAAVPMQWVDPQDFHITLISIPVADEAQTDTLVSGLDAIDTTPLSLPIGSLASFDNVGEHALHFRIRRNQALLDLQEDVYLAAQNAGCQLSSYSDPRAYIPHVTMGYAPQHIRAIAFNSKLSVQPSCLSASCEKEGQWKELKRLPFVAPVAAAPEPEPVTEDMTTEPVRTSVLVDELNAFRKFHLARWDKPTRGFNFEHITDPLRQRLITAREKSLSKDEFRHVLSHIQDDLSNPTRASDEDVVSPEQAQEWWGDYDRLLKQLGNDWLRDYMREVWRKLEPRLNGNIETGDVKDLLTDFHPDLIDKWTGTAEEPGVIAKLFMAGMGAGQAALERSRVNLNPAKAINVQVDWTLVPSDAIDAVRKYVGQLIKDIDGTTLDDVQRIIREWLESGLPISELTKQLAPIFNDPARADVIARTESSNAYTQGAINRWEQAGVEQVKWQTVRDSHICPICEPLHNKVSTVQAGFTSAELLPPAHPNCRCYLKPVL